MSSDGNNFITEEMVTLKSSDGKTFTLAERAARISSFIDDALGDEDEDGDDGNKNKQDYQQQFNQEVHDDTNTLIDSSTQCDNIYEHSQEVIHKFRHSLYECCDCDKVVELPKVDSTCLEKIVQFMNHYHYVEQMIPIPDNIGDKDTFDTLVTQEWYRSFAKSIENENVIQLVASASNYMNIQPLLNLSCLLLTFHLAGKDVNYMRKFFNLEEKLPKSEMGP
eukprot:CAMPEP_0184867754 /NCGR_PEP_ID=MMETSP0580-20130426/27607_1 /TAXON_ID=1118495 /ORGANISM="Dactyliosolen fragilissimus" /LENGTH=221 /DNA_ID=CAMNT_0027368195 /DNA_START=186 /DNA_END=847 /DNA_ORIENTATION=-